MTILAVLMLIGLNGYFFYRAVQARRALWRGGSAMVAGVGIALATFVFGQSAYFGMAPKHALEVSTAGMALALILIVYALWTRGFR